MKHLEEIGNTVRQVYWILTLKGAILIILAILILLYPPLLAVLAAIGLAVMGVLLWMLAYRVHKIWRKIPNFMK